MEVLNNLINTKWSINSDGSASFETITVGGHDVVTTDVAASAGISGSTYGDTQYQIVLDNGVADGTTSAIIPSYTSGNFADVEGTSGGFLADVNMVNDILDYVDNKISDLVNSAPVTLDTLGELATALEENDDAVAALNTAIGTKANTSDVYTKTQADATFQAKGTYLTTIPMASTTSLGGIKTNYTQQDKSYPVKIDSSGNAYVNVPWTNTNTTYSKATTSVLGLVKVGAVRTTAITTNTATTTAGKYYAVEIDSDGKLFVNVPWEDTDTVLGFATTGSGNAITSATLSGTTLTFGKDSTFFLADNFTKDNIKSTLGVSDWALSSTKPAYTTTDVTEGNNLYFTNARAQAAVTGGASTVASVNLTASRALISNSSGKIAVSAVTSTELGYLAGVTSAIQTQLNAKAPTSSLITTNTNVTNLTGRVDDIEAALGGLGELAIKDSIAWSEVTGKPTFADVATSGSYNDLTNKPTIPSLSGYATQSWVNTQLDGYATDTELSTLQTTVEELDASLGSAAFLGHTTSVTSGDSNLPTSGAVYSFVTGKGYLTSHQTIYNLTMQAGAFSAATFDPNGAAKTVNIPTKTSHLTNDSGFLTSLPSHTHSYLPLAGGTVSGDLTVSGSTTVGDIFGAGWSVEGSIANFVELNATSLYSEGNSIFAATSGNVAIGTDAVNSTYKLYVMGNSYLSGKLTVSNQSEFRNTVTILDSELYGSYTDEEGSIQDTWWVDVDGSAYFYSISQGSDITKKNVVDHDVQLTLESIANAPILRYTWLSGKDTTTEHIGSSAQYWQNVVPECVSGEEGKNLGMDYSTLGLIASIANAREILELKQEIATLKQQLSELQ